mmetsp:Transcript_20168/g.35863  ORF Transcript_20168/g.35863 Transcript_20168/m.35863 type:complete len:271 (+) Transcript_20168:52-864(+)|eukprot:CAMPEP_0197660916 /NCGR_PEP_ID=MMETSP1338-20131121/51141_1 /TAXON_ID=43686 ORGANISM="Pelagodinium beii, Strain RCC1491" /NCGR_SAMPLE_ID=MMETSP1338 /ASSEMBLY_ACC=CAM_ASM_000754 /LENGTH=270 /DNA_ID=CAMNT_0043238371 /DNA_START=43 /DNA_END=855 /DNA_ORIENTATION=+
MQPMQQRLVNILSEVQGNGADSVLYTTDDALQSQMDATQPKMAFTDPGFYGTRASQSSGDRNQSSLGQALRLGREEVKAHEQRRLVGTLGAVSASAASTLGSNGSGGRWPHPVARNSEAKRAGKSPRPQKAHLPAKNTGSGGYSSSARSPSPKVVHRHYHHHYHHHYILDGVAADGERIASLEEAEEDMEEESHVSNKGIDKIARQNGPAEVQHVHRHHHSAEAEISSKARRLLENAQQAQLAVNLPKGLSGYDRHDGRGSPDPRLPQLA